MVSAHASDTAPDPPGRETDHPERSQWPTDQQDGDFRNSASCRTSFGWQIAVELAEQGIAVFLDPIRQMNYKSFDLLTLRFTQSFDSAIIRGVGLHQVGIEPMLANDLAKAVADSGTAVVPVGRLRRELVRLLLRLRWRGKRTDLFD